MTEKSCKGCKDEGKGRGRYPCNECERGYDDRYTKREYMPREGVIKVACEIVSLAYQSIGDYQGDTLRYVRQAVVRQLKRDGHKIDGAFDPETGEPIT